MFSGGGVISSYHELVTGTRYRCSVLCETLGKRTPRWLVHGIEASQWTHFFQNPSHFYGGPSMVACRRKIGDSVINMDRSLTAYTDRSMIY